MRSLIPRNVSAYFRIFANDSRIARNLSSFVPQNVSGNSGNSCEISKQISNCAARVNYQRLYLSSIGNNTVETIRTVDYEDVKSLPKHPEKLLIDVREQEELIETGKIPTSINIPLAQVVEDLGSGRTIKDFETKFQRKKPTENTEIIFTCLRGRRAVTAAESALQLGYKNVKVYAGSWLDWAKQESLPK